MIAPLKKALGLLLLMSTAPTRRRAHCQCARGKGSDVVRRTLAAASPTSVVWNESDA